MLRSLFCVLLVAALCAGGSLPFARGGLLDTPRASVLHHTQVELGGSFTAYSYEVTDSAGVDTTSESSFAVAGHLTVGLLDRGELGVTYLGDGGISGNAKFLALGETITRPGIAIGVENLIGEPNYEFWADDSGQLYQYGVDQNWAAYVVVTKNFDYFTGAPFCINMGYGLGRFQQDTDGAGEAFTSPVPGLFVAFEFHPNMKTAIALEWDGRDANFGGSYTVNKWLTLQGAVAEFEQFIRSGEDVNRTDVMQNAKFTVGAELTIGPFMSRTHLEPTERLRPQRDEDAFQALEEARARAREKIRELQESME